MEQVASSLSEAVYRIRERDTILKGLYLSNKQYTDVEVTEMVDCLLTYPNNVQSICVSHNKLTDETGVKLAHYLASSNTIRWLYLSNNLFSEMTFMAIARALRINSSLQCLEIHNNRVENKELIESSFVDALILNPNHSQQHGWWLFSPLASDYRRLKARAEQLGHPNMQSLLATQLIRMELV